MKKIISVLLSVCIVLGVCGVSVFAQNAEAAKTIKKAEITVLAEEFYSDLAWYDCLYSFDIEPEVYIYSVDLQKNIDGEWKTFGFFDNEPIGAGTFRLVFEFEDMESESGKVEPGVTHLYIDGVDCGAVDEDYCAYSQPFELTEADTVPEPQLIEEIYVEGFKAPAKGEKPQKIEDMKVTCKGAEDAKLFPYFSVTETNLLGRQNDEVETYSAGCRYTCTFEFYLATYKYAFADDAMLYIGDEGFYLTENGSDDAYINIDFLISNLPGDLGVYETFAQYYIYIFNVVVSRIRSFIGAFWTDTVSTVAQNLVYYLELFAENIDYFLGIDELSKPFFLNGEVFTVG